MREKNIMKLCTLGIKIQTAVRAEEKYVSIALRWIVSRGKHREKVRKVSARK